MQSAAPVQQSPGFIWIALLDGQGSARFLDRDQLGQWTALQGVLWVHLDYSKTDALSWLEDASELDPLAVEALTAEETRPRTLSLGDGILAALRGVNLNPAQDPEDMVALRLYLDERRIISTRRRRILSCQDINKELRNGTGPRTTSEFLMDLTSRLVERMGDVINGLNEGVDDLEEQLSQEADSHRLHSGLAESRRKIIALRRYLAPQREAVGRMATVKTHWIQPDDRIRLREIADQTARYVEDLESARDRAAVTQDEVSHQLSQQLERRSYVLALVAVVFLPLTFFTGLLGANVGGIPYADSPWGFLLMCLSSVLLALGQIWVFRWMKWL